MYSGIINYTHIYIYIYVTTYYYNYTTYSLQLPTTIYNKPLQLYKLFIINNLQFTMYKLQYIITIVTTTY